MRIAGQVQAAIGVARRYQLPLSVRGGGHDWAGRALRPGGLVIDLTGMRQVTVDAQARTATAGGGATAGDVTAAAAPQALSAATGTVSSVGMAGLTLGGGYGPFNGHFGLALDNLLAAEVVLADGRLVWADATHEPDLYWALRGGGGNFGVVTAMRIRLHPVHQLLAGFITYPWSQVADVLAGLDSFAANAPDELTVQSSIMLGPSGGPALVLSPTWSGELTQGTKVIDEVHGLGSPLASQVAAMSHADMLGLFDPMVVTGRHYAIRTRSVPGFTPIVISALVNAGSTWTSQLSLISIHHFHGAAARIPQDATAFGVRRNHFMVEIVPAWEPEDGHAARHRAWAEATSSALAQDALPGGYPSLLGPGDHEQIADAYGANAARLRTTKARLDLDGVFSSIPLPTVLDREP